MFVNVGLEQLRQVVSDCSASSPQTLLLGLVSKVGEVSGVLHKRGDAASSNFATSEQQQLSEQLGDVLLSVVRLADVVGIDLGRAALDKLAANSRHRCRRQQEQPSPPPPPPPAQPHAAAASPPARSPPPPSSRRQQRFSLSSGLEDLLSSIQQQPEQQQPLTAATAAALGHFVRPRSSSSGASSTSSRHSAAAAFISGLVSSARQTAGVGQRPAVAGMGCESFVSSTTSGSSSSASWSSAASAAAAGGAANGSRPATAQQQRMPSPQPVPSHLLEPSPLSPQQLSPAAAGSRHKSACGATRFSATMPADDEVMPVGRGRCEDAAARLLPQGLLAEIHHGVDASSGSGSSSSSSVLAVPASHSEPLVATVTPADLDTPFILPAGVPATPPDGSAQAGSAFGDDGTAVPQASPLWLAAALGPGRHQQGSARGTTGGDAAAGVASRGKVGPSPAAPAAAAAGGGSRDSSGATINRIHTALGSRKCEAA